MVSNVELGPDLVSMADNRLPCVEQPLQIDHGQPRGAQVNLHLARRRPVVPGGREFGNIRHELCIALGSSCPPMKHRPVALESADLSSSFWWISQGRLVASANVSSGSKYVRPLRAVSHRPVSWVSAVRPGVLWPQPLLVHTVVRVVWCSVLSIKHEACSAGFPRALLCFYIKIAGYLKLWILAGWQCECTSTDVKIQQTSYSFSPFLWFDLATRLQIRCTFLKIFQPNTGTHKNESNEIQNCPDI